MFPLDWVDRIFTRLAEFYGVKWSEKIEGADDVESFKANWVKELAAFEGRPEAIRWGLANLPKAPPCVVEFALLCSQGEPQEAPKEAHSAPQVVAGPKAWAWSLKGREEAGEKLSRAQKDMWRAALVQELRGLEDVN